MTTQKIRKAPSGPELDVLVPSSANPPDPTKYLSETGEWTVPGGGGGAQNLFETLSEGNSANGLNIDISNGGNLILGDGIITNNGALVGSQIRLESTGDGFHAINIVGNLDAVNIVSNSNSVIAGNSASATFDSNGCTISTQQNCDYYLSDNNPTSIHRFKYFDGDADVNQLIMGQSTDFDAAPTGAVLQKGASGQAEWISLVDLKAALALIP